MNVTLVVGWKQSDQGPQPHGFYCGLLGSEAAAAEAAAAKSGEYIQIVRYTNPHGAPKAITDFQTVASGTPKPRTKVAPVVPQVQEAVVPDPEVKLVEARQKRLRPTQPPAKATP